jgi:hypothetical protein
MKFHAPDTLDSRPRSNGSDIVSIAEAYRAAGLQVIPIKTDGSKAPAVDSWKPYQDPANRIDLQLFGGRGVAIVGGRASGGAEFIDFDDPGLYSAWCELVEDRCPGLIQRMTIIQTPRRNDAGEFGRHVAYRCDHPSGNTDLAFCLDEKGKRKASIQTRGEGGYVLTVGCPPACHPTGRTYELLAGELTELPMLTMAERNTLWDAARALSEYDDTAEAGSNGQGSTVGDTVGDEFAGKTSWTDILTPHGWTRINKDLWRRPGKTKGWSASTKCTSKSGRELFKVFSSSASPFAADGKYNKFAAYTLLNHGGDFKAAARALYDRGFGKRDDSDVDSDGILGNGGASQDNHDGHAGQDAPNRDQKRQRPDFGRLTSAELFGQDFTVKYLISDVLADQQHGVISGRFKSQKTHIAVAAAVSIATGCPFLGKFDVKAIKRVGMFCGEGGPAPLQRMGRAICRYMDVGTSSLDKLFWFTRVPRVNDLAHRVALVDAIRADALDVVFLDPTYLLLSGVSEKASNYMIMAETLALLTAIGEETGTTCIVVHHNKKTLADFTVPELADLSFSGTAEWAGQWLLLGHRAPYDSEIRLSKLWLHIGGRLGHGGLYGLDVDEHTDGVAQWSATVTTATDARQGAIDASKADRNRKHSQQVDDMIEKIKVAFQGAPGFELTKRSLGERVGGNTRSQLFLEAIAQMIRHKEIEPIDMKTTKNVEAAGYRRLFPDDE